MININRGFYKSTYSKPEKLSEGKRLYTQRVSSGTTVPTRGYANRAELETKKSAPVQRVERAGQVSTGNNHAISTRPANETGRIRSVQSVTGAQRSNKPVSASSGNSQSKGTNTPTTPTNRARTVDNNKNIKIKSTVNQQKTGEVNRSGSKGSTTQTVNQGSGTTRSASTVKQNTAVQNPVKNNRPATISTTKNIKKQTSATTGKRKTANPNSSTKNVLNSRNPSGKKISSR